MSGINITETQKSFSHTILQPVKQQNPTPDFIPLVTPPLSIKEEKAEISILKFTEMLLSSKNAFVEWIDKINGFDKIKEFNALKSSLANIMDKNKIDYTDADITYWADIIDKNAKASNLSKELLIALIQRETSFQKCIASKTGNGPLQVTSITVQDLFSDLNGGRLVHYNNMDKAMMDDILYKEDIGGNKVPRFNSYKELHEACAKDDNLGIKVGIMCFKMKFVETVAQKKKISIADAISGLKDGSIDLSKSEQRFLIEKSLVNFNSVFTDEYAKEILDSINDLTKNETGLDFNHILKT